VSLPSKPVLLPLIDVQRCYDNWDKDSEDDENVQNEEEMGTFRLICCIFPPREQFIFVALKKMGNT